MIYGARQCASLKMAAISFYYSFVSFNSYSFYGPPQNCVFRAEFKLKFAVTFKKKNNNKKRKKSIPWSNKTRRLNFPLYSLTANKISYLHFYWILRKYFFRTETFTCHFFMHILMTFLLNLFFTVFPVVRLHFAFFFFFLIFYAFLLVFFCHSLHAIIRIVFAYIRPIHHSIVRFRAGWPLAAAALGTLRH